MSAWETIKGNWRVVLLVLMLALSSLFLFAPAFQPTEGPAAQETATNLQYGLQLSGGTRVRAPLVGVTAEEVQFDGSDTAQVERDVAAELPNADSSDVIARYTTNASGTVEFVAENGTQEELSTALATSRTTSRTIRQLSRTSRFMRPPPCTTAAGRR